MVGYLKGQNPLKHKYMIPGVGRALARGQRANLVVIFHFFGIFAYKHLTLPVVFLIHCYPFFISNSFLSTL